MLISQGDRSRRSSGVRICDMNVDRVVVEKRISRPPATLEDTIYGACMA